MFLYVPSLGEDKPFLLDAPPSPRDKNHMSDKRLRVFDGAGGVFMECLRLGGNEIEQGIRVDLDWPNQITRSIPASAFAMVRRQYKLAEVVDPKTNERIPFPNQD